MYKFKVFLTIFIIVLPVICFAEIKDICGTQEALERMQRGEKLLRPPNGPLYIYTPHFIIHFDTTGQHACSWTYAESIATFAEFSWAKQVGGLGYAAPPPDNGGPDALYDIYIRDINHYGINYLDSPYPIPYSAGYSSYIVLDNVIPDTFVLAIVSHEFNHACQDRYKGWSAADEIWWYENCASWMSVSCCHDFNMIISFYYFIYYYPNPLDVPNLNITTADGSYEYAGFLWPSFLHEYYSISSLRLMWERYGNFPDENPGAIIDTILRYYDSDLNQALTRYAVWRYFTGARADTINYFKESHLWPTSYVDPTQRHQGPGSGNQGTRNLYGPGGTSYIEFYTTPDYLLKNTFDFTNPSTNKTASCIGYGPVTQNKTYLMDSSDCWSVLPTISHDTFVFVPVNLTYGTSSGYNYSATAISSNPTLTQDPELQVCSIISPRGQISPYSSVTPRSIRQNNGTSAIDSTWVSFYIGDQYSDSRILGPLEPGQVDTISFTNWTAKERNAYGVGCIAGGPYDVNRTNNYCTTSVFVPLIDFEVLEILAPRGVVTQNVATTPRVLLRNNSTSGNNVIATLTIASYTDTRILYLGPGQSGELSFNDFTPTQLGMCTTRCYNTIPDQRPCNDIILGEILVVASSSINENNNIVKLPFNFNITPNPARTYFTICLPEILPLCFTQGQNDKYEIKIFDVTGKLLKVTEEVKSAQVHKQEVRISLKGINPGIYFLQLGKEVKKFLVVK